MNAEEPGAVSELLLRIDAGELGDPPALLAWLAGRRVELAEAELNEARRRSLLLLASGGDPHRELGVDDRAVKALAADLHTPERQAALGAGLDDLARLARDLTVVREALLFLAADIELAWRLYALGLLAEELADPDE
ncbi:MAG TPA: hypothetical protein VH063_19530 [Gaiellaceae bacterium]|jgi:hypothetical protein|nr:hypothetical protein [Gaiellaceae bacterium]